MKNRRFSWFSAALITLLLNFSMAHASERVVVSTPPLHSLVSILLNGVDNAGLLFTSRSDLDRQIMSPSALAKINQAELVVWTGAEYESALTGLRLLNPSIASKELTVSSTLPLFSVPHPDQLDRPTKHHDMRFWLDPRLAIMAVKRLAPALVKIYPDKLERILDNEIALVKALAKMEAAMRRDLKSDESVPLHVPHSDVLYLAWRFNLIITTCPTAARKLDGFDMTPGKSLYFSMMQAILAELVKCQATPRKGS